MSYIITSNPRRHWVKDEHAVSGRIDLGDVDLRGSNPRCMDRDEILLIIDAPNSHVTIDKLTLRETWLAFQFRAYQSLTVNEYHGWDCMNDGGQICAPHTTIKKFKYENEIRKLYGPLNHPDTCQVFSWVKGQPLYDINIPIVDVYLRNCRKHAGFHFTELELIEKVFIGTEWLNYDTDADLYEYWLSALNLRHSILGHPGANVSGKKIRVSDVKNAGIESFDNYAFGLIKDDAILDSDDAFMFA